MGTVKKLPIPSNFNGQEGIAVAIGTPGYMASEQFHGKPKPSSDIYSLGMVAIQALTGLRPCDLPTDYDGELIWQAYTQVSSELTSVLQKMVSYYFRDRYQNATEAIEAVRRVAKPLPNDNFRIEKAITVAEKEVFISYAWGGDSEELVNQLDKAFQKKGVTIVRDKRDLGYKGTY